jgi:hypothetical protein
MGSFSVKRPLLCWLQGSFGKARSDAAMSTASKGQRRYGKARFGVGERAFIEELSKGHENIRVYRRNGELHLSRRAMYSVCDGPCCREYFVLTQREAGQPRKGRE